MIPHTQQIVGDPARGDGHNAEGRPGDCWKTCVAALLDAPLDDVPHFLEEDDWWLSTQQFVRSRVGGNAVLARWTDAGKVPSEDLRVPGFLIASGDSPRGNFQHAVIANLDGEVIHDPHPSRAGLKGEPRQYFAVVEAIA